MKTTLLLEGEYLLVKQLIYKYICSIIIINKQVSTQHTTKLMVFRDKSRHNHKHVRYRLQFVELSRLNDVKGPVNALRDVLTNLLLSCKKATLPKVVYEIHTRYKMMKRPLKNYI